MDGGGTVHGVGREGGKGIWADLALLLFELGKLHAREVISNMPTADGACRELSDSALKAASFRVGGALLSERARFPTCHVRGEVPLPSLGSVKRKSEGEAYLARVEIP